MKLCPTSGLYLRRQAVLDEGRRKRRKSENRYIHGLLKTAVFAVFAILFQLAVIKVQKIINNTIMIIMIIIIQSKK